MLNKKFKHYRELFRKYSQDFVRDNDSTNMRLKLRHSYAVSDNMEKLGRAMNFSQEAIRIAKVIGLFHDIARFPQFAQFKTFRDDLSFNHAKKGVEIINEENFFTDEDREVLRAIKKSILNHNKETINADSMDDVSWLYARLIRDADKIDIYETLVNYHLDHKTNGKINPAIELGLPEGDEVNSAAIQNIIEGKIVSSDQIKNVNDLILLQMGWVFDINFQPSMEIIKDKKYIARLAEALPDRKEIKLAVESLQRKVEHGIK